MFRRLLAVAVCAGFFAACGAQSGTHCGDSVCKANEVCDEATKLCLANLGPKINIDAPADGAVIGEPTFELRGSATDDEGKVLGLEYALGDGDWKPLDLGESGTFGVTIDTPDVDGTQMVLQVRAHDGLNQETVSKVTVQPDRVAPKCAITAPTQDAWIAIKDGPSFQLTATATDGAGPVQGAEFSVDDGATWIPAIATEGNATAAWTLPSEDAVSHSFKFRAHDVAGNPCAANLTARVDTHAPELSDPVPANGDPVGFGNVPDSEGRVTVIDASPQLTVIGQVGNAAPTELLPAMPGANVYDVISLPCPVVDYVQETVTFTATDAAGNQGVLTSTVIADAVPPVVSITSPAQNGFVNAAQTPNSMGTLTYTMTDANPAPRTSALQLARLLGDGGLVDAGYFDLDGGASATFPVGPQDNGTPYQATVIASDGRGNRSAATRLFKVDRVAPTFSVSPGNGARHVPGGFTATFNEPVSIPDPTAFVSWNTGSPSGGADAGTATTLTWSGLGAGRSYAGTVGLSASDLAGNPVVPQSLALFTEVAEPADDAIIDASPDGGTAFVTASFDQDGVVSFAVRRKTTGNNWSVRLAHLDAQTAQPVDYLPLRTIAYSPPAPPNFVGTNFTSWMNSWGAVQPDLSASRVVSYTEGFNDTSIGTFSWGSYVGSDTVAPTFVSDMMQGVASPAVSPQAPRTGPIDYGALVGTTSFVYSRPPNADVQLGLTPLVLGLGSEGNWSVADVQTSSLKVRNYLCAPNFFGGGSTCSLSATSTVATDVDTSTGPLNPPSVAATPGGKALYVYNSTASGTRVEACIVTFYPNLCQIGVDCPTSGSQNGVRSEGLLVASSHSGTEVFGTNFVNGKYQLVSRDLEPCTGPWSVLATKAINTSRPVLPVLVGSRKAALYVDSSGNVRVWKP